FSEGEGVAVTLDNGDRRRFSEHPTCSSCGTPAPALAPSLFSFNNPRGACPACNGFGAVLEYDESLIVPDARRTLAQGALDPWTKPRYEGRRRLLREIARAKGIATDTPWRALAERDRRCRPSRARSPCTSSRSWGRASPSSTTWGWDI